MRKLSSNNGIFAKHVFRKVKKKLIYHDIIPFVSWDSYEKTETPGNRETSPKYILIKLTVVRGTERKCFV
jgi:hypothetical protein